MESSPTSPTATLSPSAIVFPTNLEQAEAGGSLPHPPSPSAHSHKSPLSRGRPAYPKLNMDSASPAATFAQLDAKASPSPASEKREQDAQVDQDRDKSLDGDSNEQDSEGWGVLRKTAIARKVQQCCGSVFRPYLVLENSGSVARDHLALERTFLSYVRTSLTLASVGIAVVQLMSLSASSIPRGIHHTVQALGAAIEVFGLIFILIGLIRYFSTQRVLLTGMFKPANAIVWAISFSMGAIVVVMFGLLLGASLR